MQKTNLLSFKGKWLAQLLRNAVPGLVLKVLKGRLQTDCKMSAMGVWSLLALTKPAVTQTTAVWHE